MDPKEKALQLHGKYFSCKLVENEREPMERVTYLHAKECAIIAVYGIIDIIEGMPLQDCTRAWRADNGAYWRNVLTELQNL